MRFTDGFWLMRPGVEAHYAREAYDLDASPEALVVTAPTKPITTRGDTLHLPELATTLERIRRRARDDFYRGETARLLLINNTGPITF